MKLSRTFPGSDTPFEGNRTLQVQGLPAGAKILSVKASVAPFGAPGSDLQFVETITFECRDCDFARGDWGATKTDSGNAVEVDFHNRRTLHIVRGDATQDGTAVHEHPTLLVDMGGAWVRVATDGSLLTDEDNLLEVDLTGGSSSLPGLTVSRFRLNHSASVDIGSVDIRSVPTNVSLGLDGLPPFWTKVGELTAEEQVPEFGDVLQAFLDGADIKNGFYELPLILHSDTIARLDVSLEVEYQLEEAVLPEVLSEVKLPYDYGSMPAVQEGIMQVRLPAGARVVEEGTSAQVFGAFEESRVVLGSTGVTDANALVPVAANKAQAQPFSVDEETPATAIDVLIASVSRTAKVELNILPDSDGKPFDDPLLERPVQISLNRDTAGTLTWLSASLSREFLFRPTMQEAPIEPIRYWLTMHAIEGEVAWGANATEAEDLGLQFSESQGLAWRQTPDANEPAPLAAMFRLRHTPPAFQMPIAFQVGEGEDAQRVNLDRFQPLGRIDFALNGVDMADAFNQYVQQTGAAACPIVEHLKNGSLDDWTEIPDEPPPFEGSQLRKGVPDFWQLTSGFTYFCGDDECLDDNFAILIEDQKNAHIGGLSQVVPIQSGCNYEIYFEGFSRIEGAVAEINWRGSVCDEFFLETETIPVKVIEEQLRLASAFVPDTEILESAEFSMRGAVERNNIPLHRAFGIAPTGATQAEIRFVAPELNYIAVSNVSFKATGNTLSSGVSTVSVVGTPDSESDWQSNLPVDVPGILVTEEVGILSIKNGSRELLTVHQTAPIVGGNPFVLDVDNDVNASFGATESASVLLHWQDDNGSSVGEAAALDLVAANKDFNRIEGTVPEGASQVQVVFEVPPDLGLEGLVDSVFNNARPSLEVRRVIIENTEVTDIPFTFVAQSPGEISLSDIKVAFEIDQPKPPAVPAEGLCPATPPRTRPGQVDKNCCHCPCCEAETTFTQRDQIIDSDRFIDIGNCTFCGTTLMRPASEVLPDARRISLRTAVEINRLATTGSRITAASSAESSAIVDTSPVSVEGMLEVDVPIAATTEGLTVEEPSEDSGESIAEVESVSANEKITDLAHQISELLKDGDLEALKNYKLKTINNYSVERLLKAISSK